MDLVTPQGALLANVRVASTFCSRLVGLLTHRALAPAEGLLLIPGGSIHTVGMRFAIDVVFVDAQLAVLRVAPAVRPYKHVSAPRGTWGVLELRAGRAAEHDVVHGVRLIARAIASR
jgi:uncharacterized membrane protein (UPF0127 family)